ncbi:MAG: SusC/RagA family TonB-linked outer membrane protein [Bacteroidales bacterium]|jgi:TonB-linked SusC/RagA family outer membrane protein|nr:SusC/RagA family TonB-linked outer membrane protein [Bacteroidales bacterium]
MYVSQKVTGKFKLLILPVLALFLMSGTLMAQNIRVTGKVIDKTGQPLMGVSVLIEGTRTGVATELDGTFSMEVPANAVLQFSAIGMENLKETVNNRKVINVTMSESTVFLDELVVTALGIKKEKKALGYAVQDIKGDEMIKVKQANLVNSLNAKVSGLNVTQQGGAPGSSASIIIRGGTSLTGDNQPLFIIDGVPIDNSTSYGNTGLDGFGATSTSTGNRAMDINSDDIESVSVLKGPSAAALYGLKAAAGAIVITTKKGKEGTATANFNSRFSTDIVNKLPNVQSLYGQGTAGVFADNTSNSWGAPIGSTPVYSNMKDFFKPAWAYDLNLSVSGGSKNGGTFFISGQRLDQKGVVPTTNYLKNSFRANVEQKLGWFTFGMNTNYVYSDNTKTLTGDGLWNTSGMGYMRAIIDWPTTDDMSSYLNTDGTKRRLMPNVLLENDIDNPNWLVRNNPINEKVQRFIGSAFVVFKPTKWFDISYRVGLDHYNQKTVNITSPGSAMLPDWQDGALSNIYRQVDFLNSNLIMNFNKKIGDIDLNLMLGHGYEQSLSERNTIRGIHPIMPGFMSINNFKPENLLVSQYISRKRLISAYGEFRASYKNYLFLSATGRNDWSSTLPVNSQSFFYPSVSGSFVFTELLPKNKILSFGKVRASWATVGKDTNPYATLPNLETVLSMGGGYRNSWSGPNANLIPEKTKSWEVGADLRFLDGRIGMDFTYYNSRSENQILYDVRLTNTTGFILQTVNFGSVKNNGIEVTINATPVQTKNFSWTLQLNGSHNKGFVYDLPQGVSFLYTTEVQMGPAKPAAINNSDFFALLGSHWQRTTDGQLILNESTGYPMTSTDVNQYAGNREPDFLIGLNNDISYKNFGLSLLFDTRIGGDIYNATEWAAVMAGTSKITENRTATKTFEGVVKKTDGTYQAFSKEVPLNEYYYKNIYTNESNHFITDVNWLRLRSLSLSYTLPESLLKKMDFIKSFQVSLSATNLFVLTNYKGFDPEVSAGGAGVGGAGSNGVDYCGVPATRSFSLGLNIKF